ncbi:MAG TPA: AAA family ATPase [archaeon]|nr:AAA family ATPase [archaeon]
MPKIVAIVGMPGAGKTEAAEFFVKKGFQFIRLGQLTMDEIKSQGLDPTEENERWIRESLRHEHGMAAYATLNFPKIDSMLKKGDVIIDGLYSWEEYLAFKEKYPKIVVVAIYASPETRYTRLEKRKLDKNDVDMRKRPVKKVDAVSRDRAQLEKLHTGGPIAMADFTIVNDRKIDDLMSLLKAFLKK